MPGGDSNFRSLMRRVQSGSEDAAEELLQTYGPHVIRAVRRTLDRRLRKRFDSIDFVQDVWAAFFESCTGESAFDQPAQLASYLATVARNKVVAEFRASLGSVKRNVNREQSLNDSREVFELPADRRPSPSQVMMAHERLEQIVDGTPAQYVEIVRMRGAGLNFREIAAQLGMHERTVRRILDKLAEERL